MIDLEDLKIGLIEILDQSQFILACETKSISLDELKSYVEQQYCYSRYFTRFLCALMSNLINPKDVEILAENLYEEAGLDKEQEISHRLLFLNMLRELGIVDPERIEVFDSTKILIDSMMNYCRDSNPLYGLSALCLGAEAIVPYFYSKILKGFSRYAVTEDVLIFFKLHTECDHEHALTMYGIIKRYLQEDPKNLSLVHATAQDIVNKRIMFLDSILTVQQKVLVS